jgi:hypothetical protein
MMESDLEMKLNITQVLVISLIRIISQNRYTYVICDDVDSCSAAAALVVPSADPPAEFR